MPGFPYFNGCLKHYGVKALFLIMLVVLSGCGGMVAGESDRINLPFITNNQSTEEAILPDAGIADTTSSQTGLPIISNQNERVEYTNLPMITNKFQTLDKLNLPIITNETSLYREGILLFTTVEQAESPGTGEMYELSEPGFAIIDSPEAASSLDPYVSTYTSKYLQSMDYDNHFSVVVFSGKKPTSGHVIYVDTLVREGNTIYVEVQTVVPEPGSVLNDTDTSPYHAVDVIKVGEWGKVVMFYLIIDGVGTASRDQLIR